MRTRRLIAVGALAVCTPLLAGACSDDKKSSDQSTTTTASSSPVNQGVTIDIEGSRFVPSSQTVNVGETVTWTNKDSSPHTVTPTPEEGKADPFQSKQVRPDESFVVTFSEAGTYKYFCSIHGDDVMSGTITVVEPE